MSEIIIDSPCIQRGYHFVSEEYSTKPKKEMTCIDCNESFNREEAELKEIPYQVDLYA